MQTIYSVQTLYSFHTKYSVFTLHIASALYSVYTLHSVYTMCTLYTEKYSYVHWPCFSKNIHHILTNISFRVKLDLYAPDFPKSTFKYLLFIKVVRKHGSRCFIAMYRFWMHWFFLNNYSELLNHLNFSKLKSKMFILTKFSIFCWPKSFLHVLVVCINKNVSKIGCFGLRSTRI